MMDLATAYFFKRYYPRVIKWWLVSYNPEVFRIWPSKEEREEALRIEAKEKEEEALRIEVKEEPPALETKADAVDDDAYNATTGSYSGLYGKGPVDKETLEAANAILNNKSSQTTVDFFLTNNNVTEVTDVILPPEQDDIIREANEIYERLLREAAEDEAKKWAEIDMIRSQTEQAYMGASAQTS